MIDVRDQAWICPAGTWTAKAIWNQTRAEARVCVSGEELIAHTSHMCGIVNVTLQERQHVERFICTSPLGVVHYPWIFLRTTHGEYEVEVAATLTLSSRLNATSAASSINAMLPGMPMHIPSGEYNHQP